MSTWQEVASQALADAYPQTMSPAELAEAIKAAGVLAWSREGLSRWLKARADEGTVDHVAFKQYRAGKAVMEPGKKASAPGRDAGTPPPSGIEWGYRCRLLKHPSGPGAGRVTERSSATRAEAEEDVAVFLEEPEKWEAEVIWRTAEVKPGEWHSLRLTVTDTLEKAGAAREDGEEVTPQVLSDLLSLTASTVIPPEVIATWTSREREEAVAWAAAEHLSASDNPVKRLSQPGFVQRTAEICASPALAQLAAESWTGYLDLLRQSEPGVRPTEFLNGAGEAAEIARDAITGLLVLLRSTGPGEFTREQMAASYNAGYVKARQDAAVEEPLS